MVFDVEEMRKHRPIAAHKALEILARARASTPRSRADLLSRRTVVATIAGKYDLVVATGRELAKIPGHLAAGIKAQAVGWLFQEKWSKAIAAWEALLRVDPEDHEAYNGLGQCFFELEDAENALRCCQKAALHPEATQKAFLNLATVCRKWFPPARIAAAGREVLRQHPEVKAIHEMVLDALRDYGISIECEMAARDFLQRWPEDRRVRMYLLGALRDGAKFEEAAREFSLLPEAELSARDLMDGVSTLTRLKRWSEARELLTKAHQQGIAPEDAKIAAFLATCIANHSPVPSRTSTGLFLP